MAEFLQGTADAFARGVLGQAEGGADLREVLLRSATDENVDRLANTVLEKAFAGDMAAARMLLLYWIGKPKEVAEPP